MHVYTISIVQLFYIQYIWRKVLSHQSWVGWNTQQFPYSSSRYVIHFTLFRVQLWRHIWMSPTVDCSNIIIILLYIPVHWESLSQPLRDVIKRNQCVFFSFFFLDSILHSMFSKICIPQNTKNMQRFLWHFVDCPKYYLYCIGLKRLFWNYLQS